jgi:hypothetical protein
MTKDHIKYIADIKYSIVEEYSFESRIIVKEPIFTYFFDILPKEDGTGSIWNVRPGYAYDGPSGPTVDTPDSMRPALEHDLKYEAIRNGWIGHECRDIADKEFHERCLEDGMNPIRAEAWYLGVHEFADYAADPKNKKKILTAP